MQNDFTEMVSTLVGLFNTDCYEDEELGATYCTRFDDYANPVIDWFSSLNNNPTYLVSVADSLPLGFAQHRIDWFEMCDVLLWYLRCKHNKPNTLLVLGWSRDKVGSGISWDISEIYTNKEEACHVAISRNQKYVWDAYNQTQIPTFDRTRPAPTPVSRPDGNREWVQRLVSEGEQVCGRNRGGV